MLPKSGQSFEAKLLIKLKKGINLEKYGFNFYLGKGVIGQLPNFQRCEFFSHFWGMNYHTSG